jgi:hypothetical protein
MKLANFSIIKFIRRRCDSARNHKKFFMCVQPARFNQMIGVKFSVATERLSKLFHEFHMRNWFSFPRELENPSNRWSTKISLLNSNKRKWIFFSVSFSQIYIFHFISSVVVIERTFFIILAPIFPHTAYITYVENEKREPYNRTRKMKFNLRCTGARWVAKWVGRKGLDVRNFYHISPTRSFLILLRKWRLNRGRCQVS